MLRTAKAKWAVGLSGALWSLLFLFAWSFTGRSSSGVTLVSEDARPWIVLTSSFGFVLLSLFIWMVFYVVDALRRAASPKAASPRAPGQ